MEKSLNINSNIINFSIPLLLFGSLIWLMKSSPLAGNNSLVFALSADLIITVPLVYFLLIRRSKIPNTTVIPVMVIGLAIGSYFLPSQNQYYLALFKTWALPAIELSVLVFVILEVRKAIQQFRSIKSAAPDFFTALKETCYEILPKKLVLPFATELAVVYYGFINWKSYTLKENEFSYHKKSGTPALLGALILIIGVETVGLHHLLEHWSPIVAWVFTGISIYSAIQFLGFAKSLSQRPITIQAKSLNLKYGILNEADIPLSDIESVELSWKTVAKNDLSKSLSPLGELESHNLIIRLKKQHTLKGLYGTEKPFQVISLHLDEPKAFKNALERVINI